jgi:sulfate adenylyltransferase large subunit
LLVTSSDLLRLATAGSVDDGKSTLIGRLLHDAKAILGDQLDDLRGRDGELDLSRLTDGLRAEREQGITIDVAYRYFATARRSFILADTPGHEQYTRNMVTGASTADLAIVLVDARNGVVEQTRRHAFIASLLGIPHLLVAVNKMDLVDFSEDAFDAVVRDFCVFRPQLAARDVAYVPISALRGDNVVDRSDAMPWYGGLPLLEHLETVEIEADRNLDEVRFPVQYVIRDGQSDYRGYAGQLGGGVLHPGDEVLVLPSEQVTTVSSIDTYDGPLETAFPPMSVTLRLADDVDVSRGDLICRPDDRPALSRELVADVCWMADAPLRAGGR